MKLRSLVLIAAMAIIFLCSCSSGYGPKTAHTNESTKSGDTIMEDTTAAEETYVPPKSFKILGIGNSFTIDTFEFLYNISKNYGAENINIACAAIGGASLATHIQNLRSDSPNYDYYFFNGTTVATSGHTLKECIKDDNWDMFVLINESGFVGVDIQYSVLQELIDYVKNNRTNPQSEISWLFSWAYQSDSTHQYFKYYNNDQTKMYNAAVNCTRKYIETNPDISVIVPLGTVFQNMRTSFIGDNLTRDGYHADLTYGRYSLALAFYCSVTGADPHECSLKFKEYDTHFDAIAEAVANAISNPYNVTRSTYNEN